MSAAKAHAAHGHDDVADDVPHLPAETGKKLLGIGGAAFAAGVVLFAVAFLIGGAEGKLRLGFSYLVGFAWTITIGLGALAFVMIQHVTKAGWSVASRRHAEWITQVLLLGLLLFVPLAIFAHDVYHHWWDEKTRLADEILRKKSGWLNSGFWLIRAAIYLLIWTVLAWWFGKTSRRQDTTREPGLTLKMQGVSAPGLFLFALSISFAAFDWIMSLDPHWYSTIFGVYVFAGGFLAALSLITLITMGFQRHGYLNRISTIEHQHDLGKLMFGFTVFWAYIAFSQFILIWYANIPEETIWYRHRWEHGWKPISLLLAVGHFAVPFLVLLSRTAKRTRPVLAAAAVWLLVMHYVDLYWLVMPTLDTMGGHGATPSWIDLAGLLAPAGLLAMVIARQAARGPIFPVGDPRLAEAAKNVNL